MSRCFGVYVTYIYFSMSVLRLGKPESVGRGYGMT
jgi:hypothetical protein